MSARPVVIAVDGPAAAGKGTLARGLADRLGFAYLDTGLLYRAVGAKVLDRGGDPADPAVAAAIARALKPGDLESAGLRDDRAAAAASRVAAIPAVRSALLDFQRDFAAQPPDAAPGAVIDGRDIGTVVCPDAAVKLFITASARVRAARRLRELRGRGLSVSAATVLREMAARDARDAGRTVAPLKPAADAWCLDTSDLGPNTVLSLALAVVEQRQFA
ncbi:MAG: (d)CMP kinase [Rhodospirillales bacterium]|nr:MAG: (d)CMP kinase [Rhodospirillales bacterium]